MRVLHLGLWSWKWLPQNRQAGDYALELIDIKYRVQLFLFWAQYWRSETGFLGVIAPTPVSQWVSERVVQALIVSDLEIAIASQSFAGLFYFIYGSILCSKHNLFVFTFYWNSLNWYWGIKKQTQSQQNGGSSRFFQRRSCFPFSSFLSSFAPSFCQWGGRESQRRAPGRNPAWSTQYSIFWAD